MLLLPMLPVFGSLQGQVLLEKHENKLGGQSDKQRSLWKNWIEKKYLVKRRDELIGYLL
jgi:hypothetical protein